MADYRRQFVRVPEPGSPQYADENIANRQLEMVGTNIVLLVHSPSEATPDDLANANLIFHGETGKPQVREDGGKYFICPGHLRDKDHAGAPASFGLFELGNKTARLTFHGIQGDLLDEKTLRITKKGKITVQG
jgi:predicted phosphodiesterase